MGPLWRMGFIPTPPLLLVGAARAERLLFDYSGHIAKGVRLPLTQRGSGPAPRDFPRSVQAVVAHAAAIG
jgi:hypothetical protein